MKPIPAVILNETKQSEGSQTRGRFYYLFSRGKEGKSKWKRPFNFLAYYINDKDRGIFKKVDFIRIQNGGTIFSCDN